MFDLLVIGAGPGGYEAAIRAAQNGLSVALCEKAQVGGTCLNRGCIPTKTLLHAAALRQSLDAMADWGIDASFRGVDISALYRKKDAIVEQLRGGIETLLRQHKITLLQGRGMIEGPGLVRVDENTHQARHILIATGSRPVMPPLPGLDLPGVITSDACLQSPVISPRLLILGGGVIGVEMASVFSALGSRVTLVEAMDRLLPGADRELSQSLMMRLRKKGVECVTGQRLERIDQADGALRCALGDGRQMEADGVLVAVGRAPYMEGLLAPGVEIARERGRILVNERFETSLPGVYAIGDATGGVMLAHAASAQGVFVADQLAGKANETNLRLIPGCIYTDPEIAFVGLTESAAKEQGIPVKTGKFLMSANGRSLIAGGERAFIKVVCHGENDRVLGAQLMCENATDLIDEFTLAIANQMTRADMLRAVRAHPTFAEGISEALEAVAGRAIHMAPQRRP